jgi:hypothetical protein
MHVKRVYDYDVNRRYIYIPLVHVHKHEDHGLLHLHLDGFQYFLSLLPNHHHPHRSLLLMADEIS